MILTTAYLLLAAITPAEVVLICGFPAPLTSRVEYVAPIVTFALVPVLSQIELSFVNAQFELTVPVASGDVIASHSTVMSAGDVVNDGAGLSSTVIV